MEPSCSTSAPANPSSPRPVSPLWPQEEGHACIASPPPPWRKRAMAWPCAGGRAQSSRTWRCSSFTPRAFLPAPRCSPGRCWRKGYGVPGDASTTPWGNALWHATTPTAWSAPPGTLSPVPVTWKSRRGVALPRGLCSWTCPTWERSSWSAPSRAWPSGVRRRATTWPVGRCPFPLLPTSTWAGCALTPGATPTSPASWWQGKMRVGCTAPTAWGAMALPNPPSSGAEPGTAPPRRPVPAPCPPSRPPPLKTPLPTPLPLSDVAERSRSSPCAKPSRT
ncbi:hypothetical protein HRbin23_01546 [bacterium HR23]|nr:hypothetical protein HRbin23_01546 [bacterium HR23]